MSTKPDETLEEIWAIRRQIAKKFGSDPMKKVAYYAQKQKERGVKIYRPEAHVGTDVHACDMLRDAARAGIAAGRSATPTSYIASRKRKAKRAK